MLLCTYMVITFFFTGILFGSFLNAWIWRTKEGMSVLKGRSICPACKKSLTWKENIPLVSFFLQRGKCSECKQKISWQYPIIELCIGIIFAFVAWFHAENLEFIFRDAFILFFLAFVFIYDLKYQEIWDRMTIHPAAVLAVASIWFGWLSIPSMLIGILVGMGFFLLQYLVSKGRWIGGGDIRLGLFMGIILGWPLILLAIFFAYVGGAILVLPFLIMGKKQFASKIPFGTYLALSTAVTIFWGQHILDWYLGMIL